MSKQELDEKDLQGVAGGANFIYVTPKKVTFWDKLRKFFGGKNKNAAAASSSSLEAFHASGGEIDLNKNYRGSHDEYMKKS